MRTLFLLTILISSQISFGQGLFGLFGYSSYEECMKEEIKDNGGKSNSFIVRYCRDKFPIKSTPSKELWKMWDDFEYLSQDDYSFVMRRSSDERYRIIRVINKTRDKKIKMIRAYFFYENDCEGDGTLSLKRSDYDYQLTSLGPGQSDDFYFYPKGEWNCYYFSARIE
tara:strand:+ start:483 stop:986 length:504 start_codon:yes stop_codon:yes gene_type:complete